MAIGKTAPNGTLNADGAFYSVQDVNVLLENASGGGELPTPTVADAGSVVVVDEQGKYALGEAGGGDNFFIVNIEYNNGNYTADKTFADIVSALETGKYIMYSFGNAAAFATHFISALGGPLETIGAAFLYINLLEGAASVLQGYEITIDHNNTVELIDYTSDRSE